MDALEEIKRLYFATTRATVQRDLTRAIELLKRMAPDDREHAAVYMDGLAQMRAEWMRGRRDDDGPVSANRRGRR